MITASDFERALVFLGDCVTRFFGWLPIDADTLFSSVLGTFVGAWAAFEFARRDRAKELRNARATEGNLALLTIFQMFNVLRQYQKEVTELVPADQSRWMVMKVTFPQTPEKLSFDPAKLAFLFECENKNILPEILIEERRFRLVTSMINRRAHLMLEKINPILSANRVPHGAKVPEGTLLAMIGPALASEAVQLTEGIVRNVDEDVLSLKAVFDALRLELVRLLNGEKFIKVEFDMPKVSGAADEAASSVATPA